MARFDSTRNGARGRLAEALDGALDGALLDLQSDAPVTNRTTPAELVELWIKEPPYAPLAEGARRIYGSLVHRHVLEEGPPLRALPVGEISPAKINLALRKISSSGWASRGPRRTRSAARWRPSWTAPA